MRNGRARHCQQRQNGKERHAAHWRAKKYPWGDAEPHNKANYDRYAPDTNFRNPPTKRVGSYAPNTYGLYDMAGNVEEWCLERLDVEDSHGRYHSMRGGSWFSSSEEIQIVSKSQHPVDGGMGTLGFRCILPQTETKSTKVATDMAAWLYDNMCGAFKQRDFKCGGGFYAACRSERCIR